MTLKTDAENSIYPASYCIQSAVSVTAGAELVLSGPGRSIPTGELHPHPEETDPGGASAAGG